MPSWAIRLERSAPLDRVVHCDEIARIQWDLFPALRALEDKVGEPIYYPFAMDSASDTRLLAGYVFKLPVLFVECFPALARVGAHLKSSVAYTDAPRYAEARTAPIESSRAPRSARPRGPASALVMR
jgi:hypothetical protein